MVIYIYFIMMESYKLGGKICKRRQYSDLSRCLNRYTVNVVEEEKKRDLSAFDR